MHRIALLLGLVASLLIASAAVAKPPTRFTFTIDETLPRPFLSAACGFDVFLRIEGTARATLFFDRTGTLIREIDTQPNLTLTFFAPSTGQSFTFPRAGALIQDYSEGATVGSPVIATLVGLIDGAGSGPPDAGRIVFEAVIVAISPEGIPVIDIVAEVSSSGHFSDDLLAARCAALSGP